MLSRMIVVMAMAATAVSCAAQQSMQSKGGVAAPMPPAAGSVEPEKPASTNATAARSPVSQAPLLRAQENHFPYPIWRNAMIDDVNKLFGVLVRTPQGTLQIQRFQWGIDEEEGYVYACYIRAYNRKGYLVSLGSPDGCKSSITKDDFFRGTSADRESRLVLKSFDFGTDSEGHLFIANPVYTIRGEATDACRMHDTLHCERPFDSCNLCNGLCGVEAGGGMIEIGRPLGPPVSGRTFKRLKCKCGGSSGECESVIHGVCEGSCPEGESCGMAKTPQGGGVCQCE